MTMPTEQIDNFTQQKLEQLFDMAGGYVLDFSNASFATFVENCLGFDPYDRYQGSKAIILRRIWLREPMKDVARLNLELLERWRFGKLANDDEISAFEQGLFDELTTKFSDPSEPPSEAALQFLAKDFSQIDLSALPAELTTQQIVAARLGEIERCLEADAPLAVIFLVGSTLEGLLMDLALAHPDRFTASSSAPSRRGRTKPINDWTLAELITVGRSINVLGEDVLKYADHVRNFRNYIHPQQQLRENFEPRAVTAQIAHQVLLAAVTDLEHLGGASS